MRVSDLSSDVSSSDLIAMRPGKPLIFGQLCTVPMLGLPGNPVSTMVCATVFLRPALERLLGIDAGPAPLVEAVLAVDLAANDRRQDYMRAASEPGPDGRRRVTPFGRPDSSVLSRPGPAASDRGRVGGGKRVSGGGEVGGRRNT